MSPLGLHFDFFCVWILFTLIILCIFEHLLDEKIDVNDFIPVMRQIQLSLDMVGYI